MVVVGMGAAIGYEWSPLTGGKEKMEKSGLCLVFGVLCVEGREMLLGEGRKWSSGRILLPAVFFSRLVAREFRRGGGGRWNRIVTCFVECLGSVF